jgi:hypothetical protein
MDMRNMLKHTSGLATAALLGGLLSAGLPQAAEASPLLVTFNPVAAGLASTGGTFQSDNQTGSDAAFATISNATGAFTESGILGYTTFNVSSNAISPNVTGLLTKYNLFFEYTAQGTLTGFNPSNGTYTGGTFSTITYTLVGNPGATQSISPATGIPTAPPSLVGGGTDITLATGGTVATSAITDLGGTPAATVDVSLTDAGTGFFAAPPGINQVQATFSNTANSFAFTPGGPGITDFGLTGSFQDNFAIVSTPEPLSLTILGMGLIGIGLARLPKKKTRG